MNEKALGRLARALDLLRTVDDDLPLQCAVLLLAVALNPGHRVMAYGDLTGLGSSSVSRAFLALSSTHWIKTKAGFGLVEARQDPTDYRAKLVQLTPRGRRLVEAVGDTIGG